MRHLSTERSAGVRHVSGRLSFAPQALRSRTGHPVLSSRLQSQPTATTHPASSWFSPDKWHLSFILRSWGSRVRGRAKLAKRLRLRRGESPIHKRFASGAGSRPRIAPGSPLDFAHLAVLRLRALRMESPNQTERKPIEVADRRGGCSPGREIQGGAVDHLAAAVHAKGTLIRIPRRRLPDSAALGADARCPRRGK
jgi:hypothetical protein